MNVCDQTASKQYESARLDHESEEARFAMGNCLGVGVCLYRSSRSGAAGYSGSSVPFRRAIHPLRSIPVGVGMPELAQATGEEDCSKIAPEGSLVRLSHD
jgi:hypothetical protein